MTDRRRGLFLGVGAYFIWGLFPLYWPLLKPAGAVEILAHRMVWSFVFVALLLAALRRWRWVRELAAHPKALAALALAAVLISVNWGTYIYGVNTERVVETSLGYFITPLISVLLGVLVLGERLSRPQWAAVGIGAVAVAVLTADYGRPPWIALVLAVSFSTYGLLKKTAGRPAIEGLAVESGLLAPLALAYVCWLEVRGDAAFGHVSVGHALLMIGAGVVTAIPLLLFAGAANQVPLSTLGVLQYLTPTMQFVLGVLVLREPMPAPRLAGFALVWLALAVFTADGLRRHRRQLAEAAEAVV